MKLNMKGALIISSRLNSFFFKQNKKREEKKEYGRVEK